MEVILLEKIRNLGKIGDQVSVKRGYCRNYLVPKGKAILATKDNIIKLENLRAELEAKAQADLEIAEKRAAELSKLVINIPAKISEEGKLFGSVNIRDIVTAIAKAGAEVNKSELSLPQGPLRQIGEYDINVHLHTDVNTVVKVKVVPAE